jgi:chromosome segregation ATPase
MYEKYVVVKRESRDMKESIFADIAAAHDKASKSSPAKGLVPEDPNATIAALASKVEALIAENHGLKKTCASQGKSLNSLVAHLSSLNERIEFLSTEISQIKEEM